jgi:hypothetical protein
MGGRGASTVVLIPLVVSSARESPARSMIPTACSLCCCKKASSSAKANPPSILYTKRGTCGSKRSATFLFKTALKMHEKISMNFFAVIKIDSICALTRHKKESHVMFAEEAVQMRNRPFWCMLQKFGRCEVPVAEESQCKGWWAVAALELDAAARGCAHKTLLSVHPSLLIGAKRCSGCHPGAHPRRTNPCYCYQLFAQNPWLRWLHAFAR